MQCNVIVFPEPEAQNTQHLPSNGESDVQLEIGSVLFISTLSNCFLLNKPFYLSSLSYKAGHWVPGLRAAAHSPPWVFFR